MINTTKSKSFYRKNLTIMNENKATHGIKFKEVVGYSLGDAGGLLTFGLVSSFLTIFYTDGLGIDAAKLTLLMIIARIWDAINDPLWGAFIDSRKKPSKYGRFKQYTLYFMVPLALAGAVMYTKIPGLSENQYLVFAYFTYIIYGMIYTCINIPFGSLASVITDDGKERSTLSMWRSIGAGLGGLPATMILPMLVYDKATNELGETIKVLNTTKFSYCVYILSALTVVVYFIHFKLTKERIAPLPKAKDANYNVFRTLGDLLKNRSFVIVSIVSMGLICFQMYTQTFYNYLLKDFYGRPGLYTYVTVFTYLPMAFFIPVMNKLIAKFGKKEICCAGLGFAAVINIVMYLLSFTALSQNPWVFLILTFFSGAGQTFLVLEVWALVMDVIDYHEYRTGRREEGTSYSVFSFTRKLGQTAAGAGVTTILAAIGYNSEAAKAQLGQTQEVVDRMYPMATLVPAIILTLMFVFLLFGYTLNKKRVAEFHAEMQRNEELIEMEA